ncbi:shikimate dehydrogenase family protein [Rhodococcus sp. 14-1411-2a]|uniref:shikimate dehydrogenase family protein n=1 Tax=Rhodococcus sp. 14-1411-2a TaxID=2023151 RepID=UPI000B9B8595|nr:shikimate dehydrogenase [Rhodococcus sp. 14-1411-2a]OZF45368.1 hypothetical protein CH291_17910 [Rhodococcus sp. 14-1411-2a]
MTIRTVPTLCWSVAANPSALGVKMHDAGYQSLGLDYKYVALGSTDIEPVLAAVRALGIRGLGVSMPHKQNVIANLDWASADVHTIGACNTVVNDAGRLSGHNTDWQGAWRAVVESGIGNVESAVVIGAGGVARAIAYALAINGARVTIAARRLEQAEALVKDLSLSKAVELDLLTQNPADFTLVVNATPDPGVVKQDLLQQARGVLDVIFQTRETSLTQAARDRGLAVVPGWRMLLHQGAAQFELYTGVAAPIEAMSQVLEAALPES